MKKFKLLYVLAAVMWLATACQDEELLPTVKPAAVGDEVIFGVRAGFENNNPDSRTVYSGETYTFGGKTYERIDWVSGKDIIEIYSPEASAPGVDNNKNSHYIVERVDGGNEQNDYGSLVRLSDAGSSLQWRDDDPHTFYALYPSERMFDTKGSEGNLVTVNMGISLKETVLNGVVPSFQNPLEIKKTEYGYEAVPDMRYAYMAAKTSASRTDTKVKLTFIPFVTAVEIELSNPDNGDDIVIGEIQIATSDGQPIAGNFTADLTGWGGSGYPECEVAKDNNGQTVNVSDQIQITTRVFNETTSIEEPITLTKGAALKFTVFLLPTQNLNDLVVRYSSTGAEKYISKTLKLDALTDSNVKTLLPAHLKTKIKGLKLPLPDAELEVNAAHWMAQLPQETTLRRLSLPGTGGSFTKDYIGDDGKYYRQQTLSLEEQWNLGIRAFEIVSNRSESGGFFGAWATPTSLANEPITCNKQDIANKTVGGVFDELIAKVTAEGSKECAVVILTYQPEDASPSRNATRYAESLKKWYDGLVANKDVFIKYTPDLTLQDAQNHIMVLVRLNQLDEKDNGSFDGALEKLKGYPFVLIDGCGTAKDRWGARGYKLNDSNFPHISNSYEGDMVIETHMKQKFLFNTTTAGEYSTSYISGDNIIKRAEPNVPADLNFGYDTDDEDVTCWYQEWARVVKQELHASDTYWFESYYEKLNNAILTFDLAVNETAAYSQHIFINSLSGYLVTAEYEQSYTPSTGYTYGGAGGDIEGLAKLITPAFYTHVLKRSKENTTGPTGIVMMDYLSADPGAGGAYHLPGLIIANNFKHN